jgi:hypothetical protein
MELARALLLLININGSDYGNSTNSTWLNEGFY